MSLSLDGTTGISASGNITGGNVIASGTLTAGSFAPTSVSSAGNITGGNILTSGLISATGNVTGAYLFGNASTVTGLSASKIFNGTSEANIGTSGGNANITIGGTSNVFVVASTGTFVTGLASVTGNVQAGNLRTAGLISATGAVTGSSVVGGVMTGSSISVTGAISGASASVSGTVTAASTVGGVITGSSSSVTGTQTAASTVGGVITGTSTSVTGTQTAASTVGGVITGTSTSVTGTVTAASTVGGVITGSSASVTGTVTGASLSGTIVTAAQTNITSVGTLGSLSVTGNVQAGNLRTAGLISATGSITTGGDHSLTGNIVDTGPLTIITGSNGNITLTPNGTGVIVVSSDIRNGQANATGNIGSSTGYFNTVFAKATSAQYADLAEVYQADSEYTPGTVLDFGGTNEVTISTQSHSTQVAGIVSTNPSYLMNSTLAEANAVKVALVGRVPCHVVGTIAKGDRLVSSSIPGIATRLDMEHYQPGCIIGKALEAYDSETIGTIEVAVGRF